MVVQARGDGDLGCVGARMKSHLRDRINVPRGLINWRMRDKVRGVLILREEGARQDKPDPVMKSGLSFVVGEEGRASGPGPTGLCA